MKITSALKCFHALQRNGQGTIYSIFFLKFTFFFPVWPPSLTCFQPSTCMGHGVVLIISKSLVPSMNKTPFSGLDNAHKNEQKNQLQLYTPPPPTEK